MVEAVRRCLPPLEEAWRAPYRIIDPLLLPRDVEPYGSVDEYSDLSDNDAPLYLDSLDESLYPPPTRRPRTRLAFGTQRAAKLHGQLQYVDDLLDQFEERPLTADSIAIEENVKIFEEAIRARTPVELHRVARPLPLMDLPTASLALCDGFMYPINATDLFQKAAWEPDRPIPKVDVFHTTASDNGDGLETESSASDGSSVEQAHCGQGRKRASLSRQGSRIQRACAKRRGSRSRRGSHASIASTRRSSVASSTGSDTGKSKWSRKTLAKRPKSLTRQSSRSNVRDSGSRRNSVASSTGSEKGGRSPKNSRPLKTTSDGSRQGGRSKANPSKRDGGVDSVELSSLSVRLNHKSSPPAADRLEHGENSPKKGKKLRAAKNAGANKLALPGTFAPVKGVVRVPNTILVEGRPVRRLFCAAMPVVAEELVASRRGSKVSQISAISNVGKKGANCRNARNTVNSRATSKIHGSPP